MKNLWNDRIKSQDLAEELKKEYFEKVNNLHSKPQKDVIDITPYVQVGPPPYRK